ncbi:MAG: hypothetical protein MK110_14545 [Fuerstiella sp.]|nr:hypothetical protein [Fuerstiella sp.]
MRALLLLIVPVLTSAAAMGHPGHGSTDPASAVHYVISPLHAGWMVWALVLFSVGVRLLGKWFRRLERNVLCRTR